MKIDKLKKYALLGGSILAFIPCEVFAQNSKITVDASKVMNEIPAYLYGACIEDVNHEIFWEITKWIMNFLLIHMLL